MSLYDTFATDKALERDGIVLAYGANSKNEPIEIRIARAGGANTRFAKVLERKLEPHRRALQAGRLDPKKAEELMIEAYAEAVVLGWTGVEDRDGNAMEFSKDNVVKLFTDLPELFKDIQNQSQQISLFRDVVKEDDAGNSQRS